MILKVIFLPPPPSPFRLIILKRGWERIYTWPEREDWSAVESLEENSQVRRHSRQKSRERQGKGLSLTGIKRKKSWISS